MSEMKSEKGFAGELAPEETLATRLLVEDPIKGWRVFSVKRGLAAQRGELLMPELANRTIRVAYADLAVRSGKLVALLSVTLAKWCIDADGRVDQAGLMVGVIDRLDRRAGVPGKNMEKNSLQPSKEDLGAIRSALGLPRT